MSGGRSTTGFQTWYDSPSWRKRSRAQLRAEPLCRRCLKRGKATLASHADHVESHNGDVVKFRTGALQSVCTACHNQKTRLEAQERRTGRPALRKGCDADGLPLDVRHPWHR